MLATASSVRQWHAIHASSTRFFRYRPTIATRSSPCTNHRCVQVRSMRIASTRAPDTCRCHASLVWRVTCRPGVTNFPPSFCPTAAAMLLPKPYTHAPYTTAPSVSLGSLCLLRLAQGCRAGAAGAGAGASQRGGQERAVVRTPPPPLSRPRVYSTPF